MPPIAAPLSVSFNVPPVDAASDELVGDSGCSMLSLELAFG
jgi:hypothetical protein